MNDFFLCGLFSLAEKWNEVPVEKTISLTSRTKLGWAAG
jgi:hypothetical protein